MFTQARIRLTLIYVITIILISGTISLWIYQGASQIVQRHYERLEKRLDHSDMPPPPFMQNRKQWISPDDLIQARNQLALRLIYINAALGLITAGAGYLLAGLTLKPIQQAMQHEKDFISNASHELRTPITALKTTLQVNLEDPKLPKSCKPILQEQLQDIDALHLLADRLLHLSNTRAITLQPLDTTPILKRITKSMNHLATQKGLRLTAEIPHKLILNADPQLFEELIRIFIDNAIKYTDTGHIILTAKDTKKHVLIQIADTGIGISSEEQKHIWDRFYRIDKSRNQPGHGLGLAVAKSILDQHHATVSIKSKIGQGTTLIITFPKST